MNQKKSKSKYSFKTKQVSSVYPLSPMQQGMLFHSLYAQDSGVYFEQISWNIQGHFNGAAFEAAWQKVVDRHSILRTFFIWENRPTPLQVVLKQVALPWTNLNWRGMSLEKQQQNLQKLLSKQREAGFQLGQAPLMEYTLIELNDDNYQFIWNYHHILLDGWSMPIIFKEVLSFYEAEQKGQTLNLPKSRPYGDYITWLKAQDKEEAIAFWQKTLEGKTTPTPLTVDKYTPPRQKQQSDYQEITLQLSTTISSKLKTISQQNRVTLSTIVQAAWALLLSRYSREQDVLFGVTTSGRTGNLSGEANMVGLFINTLPLRIQVPSDGELIPWLEQIQQSMVQLQQYSYTSLIDIQALCELPGGTSLFESIVVFENYPIDASISPENSSLQLNRTDIKEHNNYPLTIVAVARNELSIRISYDHSCFEAETIERMLGHLQTIFTAIAEKPQQTVEEIPLLSEEERHQLLVEWNDTDSEYPQDKCIHQLFEKQVEETPKAIAVVFEEELSYGGFVVFEKEELSYGELNAKANQLAHYLSNLGVKAETLVGICVERSIEMVIGLLGILKAGGAYVPLDPKYPAERLSYMLDDAQVSVLLTQDSLRLSLPNSPAQVVCLDSDWGIIEQQSKANYKAEVEATNLAYIIYTSGSTGTPKGVAIEHQGVVRLVQETNYINFTAQEVFLQLAPVSFDASTFEIWGSLLNGAQLVIMPVDPPGLEDIAEAIEKYQVTTLFVTTALFNLMAEQQSDKLRSIRQLLTGGEIVSPIHIARMIEHLSGCQIIHCYGPTENTTFTCCYPVKKLEENEISVPIGRPIANTQIYILDKHLQPVPIGVVGEIYIGGDGLARGYLNRPELTEEKFSSNPFGPGKLYQTGDLACYLADGDIQYIERIDNQVKLRGFRIELGEIEASLMTHPKIRQAIVLASEELSANKRLVAYVVSEEDSDTSNNTLRQYLLSKLPEYMVPSVFVSLENLPLTPNGKVDRKALPIQSEEDVRSQLETKYIKPESTKEKTIAQVWQEILGIEKVGIKDNFFDLGGNSLLLLQLQNQLSQKLEQNLSIVELFQYPNIQALATYLNQKQNPQSNTKAISNQAETRRVRKAARKNRKQRRGKL